MSERQDAPEETGTGYTPDRVPTLRIGVWVAALGVVLALTVVGLYQLFLAMAEREVFDKELKPVSPALRRERDREASALGRYEVVDEQRGRYRIPIGRAMELLVAEPARLAPASAPAPASQPPASSLQPSSSPGKPPKAASP